MSTGSCIIAPIDNKWGAISVWCGGLPSDNGRTLVENYSDPNKIKKLILLGDLSFLCESPEQPEGHNHKKIMSGYCLRKEDTEGAETRFYDSLEEALDNEGDTFTYVFKDNIWRFSGDEEYEKENIPLIGLNWDFLKYIPKEILLKELGRRNET